MIVSPDRTVLRFAGAAVMAAVVLACAPDRASAGCGEHGTIFAGGGLPTPPPITGDGPSPKRPCHGPNCSEAPAAPQVPPSAPVSVPVNDVKACLTGPADPREGSSRPVEPTAEPLPVGRALPVYHPPRG